MVKCKYEKHNFTHIGKIYNSLVFINIKNICLIDNVVRKLVLGLQFEYTLSKRNIAWTACLYHSNEQSDGKEKPVLQVISPNLKKEEQKDILENVKEKSLEVDGEPKQILSADSIKKFKEKIIGKSEKEADVKPAGK